MFVTWNCTKTNFNNSRLKKFFIDIISSFMTPSFLPIFVNLVRDKRNHIVQYRKSLPRI